MFKDWFKSSAEPATENPSGGRTWPRLFLNPDLGELEVKLLPALHRAVEQRLDNLVQSHTDAVHRLLTSSASDPPVGDVERAQLHLQSLAVAIGEWPSLVWAEINRTFVKDGEAVFPVFFATATTASHYEAIVLDKSITYANKMYDVASDIVLAAIPGLPDDAADELRGRWELERWRLQEQCIALCEGRLSHLWGTMNDHRDAKSTVDAFVNTARTMARYGALEKVRLFRKCFLPVFYDMFGSEFYSKTYTALTSGGDFAQLLEPALRGIAHNSDDEEQRRNVASYLAIYVEIESKKHGAFLELLKKVNTRLARYVEPLGAKEAAERLVSSAVFEQFADITREVREYTLSKLP